MNNGETLAQCLASVRMQSVVAEHIIVDGGSTDSTPEVIESCRSSLGKIIMEPDQGIYDAMNKGIRHATGEIVGILNADDFYPAADVLEKVVAVFSNPAIEACYGDLRYVHPRDTGKIQRYWRSGEFHPDKFYWGWMPPHPTFFVRRAVYEKYGLFRPELGTAADYELMLRLLLKHRIQTVYIPETLVHMRSGGASNRSIYSRLKASRMDREAWKVNDMQPYPWTLLAKPLRKLGQWFIRAR